MLKKNIPQNRVLNNLSLNVLVVSGFDQFYFIFTDESLVPVGVNDPMMLGGILDDRSCGNSS
jgi:hypothetical protein